MAFIDDQVGTFIIGSWLQTVLWTVEMLQIYVYFQRYKDIPVLRYSIGMLAVVDTVGVIVTDIWVYRASITDFGSIEKATGPGWELCTVVAVNLYAATCCQGYLVFRYRRISKDFWFSGFLAFTIFGVGALSVFVVYATAKPGSQELLVSGKIAALVMFAIEALVDIAIAGALAYFLVKRIKADIVDRTRRLLNRLAFIAIESGVLTAVLAIITLVVTLTMFETSNLCYLFVMLLGRTYALTLLFNLNMRGTANRVGSSGEQERTGVITAPGLAKQGQVSVFQLAELRSSIADDAKVPPRSVQNELEVEYTKETFTRMDV